MNRFCYVLPLLLASLLTACDGDDAPVKPAAGYEYYPLEVGRFWEYDVTEVRYETNVQVDSATYQLREEIDTTGTDLQGRGYYRVIRSRRASSSAEWQRDSIITLTRQPTRLERFQNNRRVIQLAFPVVNGKRWNGDTLNSTGSTYFTYRNAGEPVKVKNPVTQTDTTYQNGLRVVQLYDSTLINIDHVYEIYVKDVGMVKRYYKRYNSSDSNTGFLPDYIQKGSRKVSVLTRTGRR